MCARLFIYVLLLSRAFFSPLPKSRIYSLRNKSRLPCILVLSACTLFERPAGRRDRVLFRLAVGGDAGPIAKHYIAPYVYAWGYREIPLLPSVNVVWIRFSATNIARVKRQRNEVRRVHNYHRKLFESFATRRICVAIKRINK